MEGEHGFNTREEWQNYFQIYFDQIRELEEIKFFSDEQGASAMAG